MYSHTLSLSNLIERCDGDVEPSDCVFIELNHRTVVGCVCGLMAIRFHH